MKLISFLTCIVNYAIFPGGTHQETAKRNKRHSTWKNATPLIAFNLWGHFRFHAPLHYRKCQQHFDCFNEFQNIHVQISNFWWWWQLHNWTLERGKFRINPACKQMDCFLFFKQFLKNVITSTNTLIITKANLCIPPFTITFTLFKMDYYEVKNAIARSVFHNLKTLPTWCFKMWKYNPMYLFNVTIFNVLTSENEIR